MYPYYHSYDLPASTPRYVYSPSSAYVRPDPTYWQALAEEEAARRQYQQALREQEDASDRAARARLARQVFESPYESPSYDSYLAEDDDYSYGYGPRTGRAAYLDHPYLSPQQQRAYLRERQRSEQQRRLEALEREREKERQRIVALEEERKRRLLEEERRRRIMLEEEERQRRREEERQRREDDEYLRRQASPTFSPLDELLGFRPSRFMPPEMNPSRRARTTSPGHRTRTTSTTQRQQPSQPPQHPAATCERSSSRTPGAKRVPITSPKPTSEPSPPHQTPHVAPRSPSPRRYTAEEVDAAEKIQTFWRKCRPLRAALASIASLTTKFEQAKSAFTFPATLDYTLNGRVVPVPATGGDVSASDEGEIERTSEDASLAFTPTNVPVHAYEEELNRILMKLDGVQSGGDELVRNRRRELVRKVESEAERIEKAKVLIWRAWIGRKDESQAMSVDEEKEPELAAEPEHPSGSSAVEEMQVDSQDPSTDFTPPEPVTLTDLTSNGNAEAAEVQEPSEMQVEAALSSTVDAPHAAAVLEPMSPTTTLLESSDHAGEGPQPSATSATDEMQVEEEDRSGSPASPEIPLEESSPTAADLVMGDTDDSNPEMIPVIVEEPDPDVDEHSSEGSLEESDEVIVEAPAEITDDEASSEIIIHPPLSPFSPTDSLSPPPMLVYSASEAEDSTPPHTPPASHEELPETSTKGSDGATTPTSQSTSVEKLHMLKPLVTMDWDEEIDFF